VIAPNRAPAGADELRRNVASISRQNSRNTPPTNLGFDFELTTLPEQLTNIANVHLDASEYQDKIVFLHAVKSGPASQSYGLQVAKLAGVPNKVIFNAKQKLVELEDQAVVTTQKQQLNPQPDLFLNAKPSPLAAKISMLNADELTPMQALDTLYQLIEIHKQENS